MTNFEEVDKDKVFNSILNEWNKLEISGYAEETGEDIEEWLRLSMTKLILKDREERDSQWKEAILKSSMYHLTIEQARAFVSDVLLILSNNTKEDLINK